MKHARVGIILAVLVLTGAGCWPWQKKEVSAPVSDPAPEFLPRQDVNAPSDAWGEYQRAQTAQDTVNVTGENASGMSASVQIPKSWAVDRGRWRPTADDKLNHLRIVLFDEMGPETEWSNQQKLSDHRVIHAEKTDGKYVLLVDHDGLKASILKVFIPNPQNGQAFFLVECRVAWDAQDRDGLWSACRAAAESAQFTAS